jgi:hypothetical protein
MNEQITQCYGCDGKGWVDSKHLGPTICPICKGSGKINKGVVKDEPSKNPAIFPPSVTPKSNRHWAFCEAINADDTNIIRYSNSVACWRAEIGDPKTTGYTGWENADATESFRHKGWGVAFGNPLAKEKGMRVIRPLTS